MSLATKMVLIVAYAVVAGLLVFSVVFFRHPIATTFGLRRSALRRSGFQRLRLKTSAGIQTVWHGGSGPTLVLLHGAGDQAGTWYRIAPELKQRYHLVIPDLAGHGESEPSAGPLSLGTLLSALEQALDAIFPKNVPPMIFAGNSLGAWVTMLYASNYPQRVERAILIDGGPIRHVSEIGIMPKDREEARRAMDAVLDPSTPRRPNFVLDDLVRVSNAGPISRLLAAGEADMSKYLLEDKLVEFRVPVNLIWGASDRLVPVDYAKKLQSTLSRCTLTVIEGCGHAPQLERPHELLKVLSSVLTSDSLPSVEPHISAPVGPAS